MGPTRFGERFRVRGEAGSGGMGTVYHALYTVTGQDVALKVLHETIGTAADRFNQEAALLAELVHPAIVRYVDHGTTPGGERYLAMEWLDGETLEQRLVRGALGILDTLRLGRRVLEALAVAHRKGIVHRDLKPANLFLPGGDLGQVKLLDFGIAQRNWDSRRTNLTRSALGTAPYMSPEQVRGEQEVDGRSDLFSLGCVLYEAVAGEAAFNGQTALAVMASICLEDSVQVGERRPDLPAPFSALLTRMLAKDPAHRPASAIDLAREMGRLIGTLAAQGLTTGEMAQAGAARRAASRLAAGEQRAVSAIVVSNDDIDEAAIATVEQVVARFGARVDRFTNGAMVISLVEEGTPTDQATQAARCILTVKTVLPRAAFALCTGRVELEGERPLAELISRGFDLVRREDPGAVRLDDVSAGLLEARFEIRSASGAGALADHRLLFEKGLREPPRTVLGREIPCVGREREIETLLALWDECTGEPVARAVMVTSPAGGGKSRVRYEVLERIHKRALPFELLIARSDSMRAGAPFALLASGLRAAFGIQGGEPAEVQRARVVAHVERHLAADTVKRVSAFLGEIVGIPFPDDDLPSLRAARHDPRLMADQTLTAWLDFIDAECAARPVLLLFEDLHWGDVPSFQLVDAALRTLPERPLLVMAFSRPEIDERFPGLWNDRNLQRLSLAPLTPRSAQKMIGQILANLPEERVAWIVERAGGNPFYLEELVRAVGSGAGSDAANPLPDTVIGMVQARLDAIGGEGKRALRAGAIFGQTFRASGVRALLGDEDASVEPWLDILAQKEVLFPRQIGGTREYTFRHALVQEAAYAMLTASDRTLGHRLAGQFLEAAGERQSILLVEHYERGGEPGRAAHFCRPATQQALDANDLAEVIRRAERGFRLGASGEDLGAIRLSEAQARFWRGEYTDAETAARDALEHVGPEARLLALSELAVALGQQSKFAELKDLVTEVRASDGASNDNASANANDNALSYGMIGNANAEVSTFLLKAAGYLVAAGEWDATGQILDQVSEHAVESSPVLARLRHKVCGFRDLTRGNHEHAVKECRAALRLLEGDEDVRGASEIQGNLAIALFELGALEEGEEGLRAILVTAQRLGLGFITVGAMVNLTQVLHYRGDLAGARRTGEQALSMVTLQGDHRMEGMVMSYLSAIEHDSGNHAAALALGRRAVEAVADVAPLKPLALAALAQAELALGSGSEALAHARAARALLPEVGQSQDDTTVRVVFIETLIGAGEREAARAEAAAARALLEIRVALIDNPTYRNRFMTEIPPHARLVGLGKQLES